MEKLERDNKKSEKVLDLLVYTFIFMFMFIYCVMLLPIYICVPKTRDAIEQPINTFLRERKGG